MKQQLQFCVYKITNSISGKSYIGKTKNLKKRWDGHLNRAKNTNINNKFPNALRKYPKDSWNISVLYETDDENHSYEVEALLIEEHNTFKSGYNSCGGGNGVGSGEKNPNFGNRWKLSQEQKDARSGKNHPMFGSIWSQEQKDARSGKNSSLFGSHWSQERKDAKSGKNSPMYGTMPWETLGCKSRKLQINWFYLDKVYNLRTKCGYGQKRMFEILVVDYPNIKKSPTSFQNMFRWIEKHGNPIKNKDWLDFHIKFKI